MSKHYLKLSLLALCFLLVTNSLRAQIISANPSLWEKISIQFEGPKLNETSASNPFTDYRMDVEFVSPTNDTMHVPGFFAADGNSAESSAESGNIWQVNFAANKNGTWSFKASFVTETNIAAQLSGGESAGFFDGSTGTFEVTTSTIKSDIDFRAKGKLEYVGEHFLKFQETGEYFIKAGANSPEVFLEYQEFDNTPSNRTYPDFIADWSESDPSWKGGKGKGIIGVVNYLSSININSYYFLSMNAYGDGKKAWPWIHQDSLVRYDVSKLEQWDIVFQHMNAKGVNVHMVLTETENEALFELVELGLTDGFADSRKIYYREMIARYGYLPAVTWNIGEENGWAEGDGFHTANTNQQRKDFSDRLRALTYYNDHISIHNGPSTEDYIFNDLVGHESLTGPAFQWDFGKNVYEVLYKWRKASAESGHKWVMSFDEPYVNPPTEDLDEWRTDNIWPTFMAGCAGIELYIGSGLDLSVQDFRTYEDYYNAMTIAANFFRNNLPFSELEPDAEFFTNGHTLRLGDSIFVLYIPNANETIVDLPVANYKVEWFDPKMGGEMVFGNISYLIGSASANLGKPNKNSDADWVCVVRKIDNSKAQLNLSTSVFQLKMEQAANISEEHQQTLVATASLADIDSAWIGDFNANWLSAELKDNNDNTWTLDLSLNENAKALAVGIHQIFIPINAKNATPIYANFELNVIYNLNGHKYFYVDNGIAVMEMESNPLRNHWESETAETGFSGNGYYFYNGPFLSEPEDTNVFEYYFYVPKAGSYVVAIRNFIPNSDYTENNDTWLKMDNDRWWKHFSHTNQKWNWETQLDDGDENFSDPIWDLEEGFHALRIGGRSDNFYLDKIHVYKENTKEQFVTDELLIQSGQSDRNIPILSLSKGYYTSNYKEGSIPTVKNRSVNIKNAGIDTLGDISVETDADFISAEISGEGNSQKLIISFGDEIKELSGGTYAYSVKLNCSNASTREIKMYFNIESTVGINEHNSCGLTLKNTLIDHYLVFTSTEPIPASIEIININGQVVFIDTLSGMVETKVNIDFLEAGTYVIRTKTTKGINSQKIVKR